MEPYLNHVELLFRMALATEKALLVAQRGGTVKTERGTMEGEIMRYQSENILLESDSICKHFIGTIS